MADLSGKYKVYYEGKEAGLLSVRSDGLMSIFQCDCEKVTDEVTRLHIHGGGKTARLGVLVPEKGRLRYAKKFSRAALAGLKLGQIDSGEIISAAKNSGHGSPGIQSFGNHAETDIEAQSPGNLSGSPAVSQNSGNRAEVDAGAQNSGDAAGLLDGSGEISDDAAKKISEILKSLTEIIPKSDADAGVENTTGRESDNGPPKNAPPQKNASGTGWTHTNNPGAFFADAELKKMCSGVSALIKTEDGVDFFAVPISFDEPFPLMPIFCFGNFREISGRSYLVFKIKNGCLTM